MPPVKLQTSDKMTIHVDGDVAKLAPTIRAIMERCTYRYLLGGVCVPLPTVSAKVLNLVLVWITHHKDDAACVEDLSEWDQKFLSIDKATLMEVVSAANCLGVKGLVRMGCRSIIWAEGKQCSSTE